MKELFDYQDIQHLVWINWYHANRLVVIYSDKNLTKVRGIPYEQFLVLSLMNKLGKNANATELGKILNKHSNTLSTILDRMEEKGLVKRQEIHGIDVWYGQ